jgi:hypothetical protein
MGATVVHLFMSEKPCLGCNGLSRISAYRGLRYIISHAGRAAYKSSQAVASRYMARNVLTGLQEVVMNYNHRNSFPTILDLLAVQPTFST